MKRAWLAALAIALVARSADAQEEQESRDRGDAARTSAEAPDLRARFGYELADRLMHSSDPDERLRGVERASSAASSSPEALLLLVRAAEPNGMARSDGRVALELARALASHATDPKARGALQALVAVQPQGAAARAAAGASLAEADLYLGRLELARETAALALAHGGEPRAIEWLISNLRNAGVAQTPSARALAAYPPAYVGAFQSQATVTVPWLRVLARVGDLRAIETARAALRASDVGVRAQALITLGELGDMRIVDAAVAAAKEHEPRLRVAGAEALVDLAVPERAKAVLGLLGDEATALAGAELAERASSEAVARALSARALASREGEIRSAAIAALGRSPEAFAVRALSELAKNPALAGEAARALARSPAREAPAAIAELAKGAPPQRRLAVRAYGTRALERGERDEPFEANVIAPLARGADPKDRAVATWALVTLGAWSATDGLRDPDARVRRASASAALARGPIARATRDALEARMLEEKDETTRTALAIALVDGDPDGHIPTLVLLDRAESTAADAPLAALALAARGDEAQADKIATLLASPDPMVRAHVARGLGATPAKDASGRLALAYAYEVDVEVRRAIVGAIAARTSDGTAPSRARTLEIARELDPDPACRAIAARALAGRPAPSPSDRRQVAWLHVSSPGGAAAPSDVLGSVVGADGVAIPVAFDDDGWALVAGLPPGEARLVLAPRPPRYEGSRR